MFGITSVNCLLINRVNIAVTMQTNTVATTRVLPFSNRTVRLTMCLSFSIRDLFVLSDHLQSEDLTLLGQIFLNTTPTNFCVRVRLLNHLETMSVEVCAHAIHWSDRRRLQCIQAELTSTACSRAPFPLLYLSTKTNTQTRRFPSHPAACLSAK